jgi:pantoate--beta-alanine ligase
MGYLHEGHVSLVRRAREECDEVAVSIFVNPAQFGPGEDLAKYPRTFVADCEGCRARGADVLFAPRPEAMYPPGFQTHVEVERLSGPLCGAARPGHFRGVATVVLKLLLLAQPTHALFGWKDAQQFLVLRRMVADLAFPVEMIGVETVREADGLAMSSRNAYLTAEERAEAPRIYAGLCAARAAFDAGERSAAVLIERVRAAVEASPRMRVDYIEARDMDTLDALETAQAGNTLLAAAVHLGRARLIDNIRF